jgi:hypothetical protein
MKSPDERGIPAVEFVLMILPLFDVLPSGKIFGAVKRFFNLKVSTTMRCEYKTVKL